MAKIRQKTVVEQVMEQIKELIASGKYKPGDKLPTEHELAEKFGIGRSSIREAIKIFNYLGVLKSKAAKGTFLSDRGNISAEAPLLVYSSGERRTAGTYRDARGHRALEHHNPDNSVSEGS